MQVQHACVYAAVRDVKGGLYFETGLTAYATQLTQLMMINNSRLVKNKILMLKILIFIVHKCERVVAFGMKCVFPRAVL